MERPATLKSLERQAFKTSFSDGLWDVFAGCIVLILALAPMLSAALGDFWGSMVFLPFWAAVYAGIWLLRRDVVAPRIGTVTFRPARKRRVRLFVAAMVGVTLLLAALTALALRSPAAAESAPAILAVGRLAPGLLALIGFGVAAYLLDHPPFYLYGLLLFLAVPVGEWLRQVHGAPHHGFPIVFGITAAVMIAAGLIQFALMLRRNPPVEGEDTGDDAVRV